MGRDTLIPKLLSSGEIYLEITAGWVFLPNGYGGFFDEESLRMVADFLEKKNKELFADVDDDGREATLPFEPVAGHKSNKGRKRRGDAHSNPKPTLRAIGQGQQLFELALHFVKFFIHLLDFLP